MGDGKGDSKLLIRRVRSRQPRGWRNKVDGLTKTEADETMLDGLILALELIDRAVHPDREKALT